MKLSAKEISQMNKAIDLIKKAQEILSKLEDNNKSLAWTGNAKLSNKASDLIDRIDAEKY